MHNFADILVGVQSLAEAQRALEVAHRVSDNVYFRSGQVAWLTLPFSSTPFADALRLMNRIGVNAAPLLVNEIVLPSGESVVIYEIPGLPEVYPSPFSGKPRLEKGAVERLRQDIELMFATGYVHPLAVKDFDTWRLVSGTGLIVFEQWESLRAMSPDEIDDARVSVEKLIATCE